MLDEVRHRNLRIYSRLLALLAANPHTYVFDNEHHNETYIGERVSITQSKSTISSSSSSSSSSPDTSANEEKEEKESANDRNDRAIRKAALWYSHHLSAYKKNIVLLTNDADNKRKADAMTDMFVTKTIQQYGQFALYLHARYSLVSVVN